MTLYLLITIDTETSIGYTGKDYKPIPPEIRIQGKIKKKYYGIPLIMDLLEKHSIKGVFFLNAYEYFYHKDKIKKIAQEIKNRGHEVQLHVHKEWMCFKGNKNPKPGEHIKCLPLGSTKKQSEIIKIGKNLIQEWTGEMPIAHRGGSYKADLNTIKALKKNNIPIDSSINSPSHELSRYFKINQVSEKDSIIQIPLYNFQVTWPKKKYRQFDIEANNLSNLKFLVKQAKKNNISPVILMMHSWSLMKGNKYKYSELNKNIYKPDKKHIKRFDKFLAYVSKDPEVKAITMKEFYSLYKKDKNQFKNNSHIPKENYFLRLQRSFARFSYQKSERNFALANCILFILFGAIIYKVFF